MFSLELESRFALVNQLNINWFQKQLWAYRQNSNLITSRTVKLQNIVTLFT